MTPLRWLAKSRLRLATAALLLLGLAFGSARPLATWIRDASDSPSEVMGLLLAFVSALLLGAFCLAVLAGDRLFPHRWRERVVCGYDVPLPADVLPKSHVLGFSVVLVGVVAILSAVVETVTGGFFAEYQRIGHKRTILRSDNTELKRKLLVDLGEVRLQHQVEDALLLLDMTWRNERQPEEIRTLAVMSLGRQVDELIASIESWRKEGVHDHWEIDRVKALRRDVAPEMRAAIEGDPSGIGPHLALSLGKLRDRASLPLLLDRVKRGARAPDELFRASALALGLVRDPDALAPLARLAPDVAPEGFTPFAWAVAEIARHYVPESDKAVDAFFGELVSLFAARLDGDRDPAVRCACLHVLRATGDDRIVEPLLRAFDSEGSDGTCAVAYVDVDDRAPRVMALEEPFRLRVLQALAHVVLGDDRFVAWAKERVSDERYSHTIRTNLAEMLRQAEAAGSR